MNALVDAPVIKALYRASQAGVSIDLIVRGICCLRPGVPGISDNIRVISIVDRFLEHARIFYFEAGGKREVYLSSADWMPRNFQRRVEVMFPIEDEGLRDRVIDEILAIALADNVKARQLLPDGGYVAGRPSRRDAGRCAASTDSWSWRARRRRPGRRCPARAAPTTSGRRRRPARCPGAPPRRPPRRRRRPARPRRERAHGPTTVASNSTKSEFGRIIEEMSSPRRLAVGRRRALPPGCWPRRAPRRRW